MTSDSVECRIGCRKLRCISQWCKYRCLVFWFLHHWLLLLLCRLVLPHVVLSLSFVVCVVIWSGLISSCLVFSCLDWSGLFLSCHARSCLFCLVLICLACHVVFFLERQREGGDRDKNGENKRSYVIRSPPGLYVHWKLHAHHLAFMCLPVSNR